MTAQRSEHYRDRHDTCEDAAPSFVADSAIVDSPLKIESAREARAGSTAMRPLQPSTAHWTSTSICTRRVRTRAVDEEDPLHERDVLPDLGLAGDGGHVAHLRGQTLTFRAPSLARWCTQDRADQRARRLPPGPRRLTPSPSPELRPHLFGPQRVDDAALADVGVAHQAHADVLRARGARREAGRRARVSGGGRRSLQRRPDQRRQRQSSQQRQRAHCSAAAARASKMRRRRRAA